MSEAYPGPNRHRQAITIHARYFTGAFDRVVSSVYGGQRAYRHMFEGLVLPAPAVVMQTPDTNRHISQRLFETFEPGKERQSLQSVRDDCMDYYRKLFGAVEVAYPLTQPLGYTLADISPLTGVVLETDLMDRSYAQVRFGIDPSEPPMAEGTDLEGNYMTGTEDLEALLGTQAVNMLTNEVADRLYEASNRFFNRLWQ